MSPRWYDGKDYLPLDTGGGPIARLWSTALSGLVDIGYVKATGNSVQINLPKTALKGPVTLRVEDPAMVRIRIERDRARTYFQAYAAACALHFLEKAMAEVRAGKDEDLERFQGAEGGHELRLHRGGARRAVASHGDPRTARSPTIILIRRRRGTPARAITTARPVPTKMPCRGSRSSKRTAGTSSKASTSCARCAASIRACRAACTCISATAR